MIIDTNAYLGFFAFRQIRHNTAPELLRLMDAKGIDRAPPATAPLGDAAAAVGAPPISPHRPGTCCPSAGSPDR